MKSETYQHIVGNEFEKVWESNCYIINMIIIMTYKAFREIYECCRINDATNARYVATQSNIYNSRLFAGTLQATR